MPEFLYKFLLKYYDVNLVNTIINGYSKQRFITLRVNTLKSNCETIKNGLVQLGFSFKEVYWNKDALIIINTQKYDIRKTKMYINGEIYLQSLSSMIPPIVLSPENNESILDMTAAPGGKTTQMCALSNNEASITACEKNKIRFDRLKYNLEKQGATRVTAIQQDSRKLDDFFSFDKILLDAPCSGSGTINIYDKNLDKNFTIDLINRSTKLQIELLYKAYKLLKPNGEMVYSTCSILKEENEDIVKRAINELNLEIVPITIDFSHIPLLPVTLNGTICICPTEFYEGFFVAKLRKK